MILLPFLHRNAFAAEGIQPPAVPSFIASIVSAEDLPDAPVAVAPNSASQSAPGEQAPARGTALAERFLNAADPGYLRVGDKWDVTINKDERVRPYTRRDKLQYAYEEEASPFALFDAAWSAGNEHLRDGQPHFGSDKAGFGERMGAAAFRQGTYRLFGDDIFPALLHEDPRYYRIDEGTYWHRFTRSALQTLWDHRDNGTRGVNFSCLAGEAISNTLPLTFYPHNSAKLTVAAAGIGTSLAADAGLKLFREFAPDLFRAAHLIPATKPATK